MAAIVTVSDGNTALAAHVNQYATALSNVLGITDTAQTALGRLVMPSGTSDPASPAAGQEWLRTDQGLDGRRYIRKNSKSTPQIGLRQRILSSDEAAEIITSSSYTDVGNLTLSITTLGGRLAIFLIAGTSNSTSTSPSAQIFVDPGASAAAGDLRAVVGATNLAQIGLYFGGGAVDGGTSPAGYRWEYTPAAGTYTIKIQGRMVGGAGGDLIITNTRLVAEEWDE